MSTYVDRMMHSERVRGNFSFPFGFLYFSQKLADASKQLARRYTVVSTFFSNSTNIPMKGFAIDNNFHLKAFNFFYNSAKS